MRHWHMASLIHAFENLEIILVTCVKALDARHGLSIQTNQFATTMDGEKFLYGLNKDVYNNF